MGRVGLFPQARQGTLSSGEYSEKLLVSLTQVPCVNWVCAGTPIVHTLRRNGAS